MVIYTPSEARYIVENSLLSFFFLPFFQILFISTTSYYFAVLYIYIYIYIYKRRQTLAKLMRQYPQSKWNHPKETALVLVVQLSHPMRMSWSRKYLAVMVITITFSVWSLFLTSSTSFLAAWLTPLDLLR